MKSDLVTQYFEAILQLRDCSPKIKSFVDSEIRKNQIGVAKLKTVPHGFDYYLSDDNRTKILGKKLQQTFGGEFKVTASLFSHKDGKNIYRMTVLFREIPFKKGEKVLFSGEEYHIELIHPEIVLRPLSSGKKIRVKHKNMRAIKNK